MSRELLERHSLERDYSPDVDRRKRVHDAEDSFTYNSKHEEDIIDNKRKRFEESAVSKGTIVFSFWCYFHVFCVVCLEKMVEWLEVQYKKII